MNKRILLVEDEPGLVMTLTDRLRSEGYTVETAPDGDRGLDRAIAEAFDVIILDVMLPRKNGLDMCRDMRQQGVLTPTIMLTARGQLIDKVLGLKLGADDYLTKPFEMIELLARLEALVRRAPVAPAPPPSDSYQFGPVRVDFRSAEVNCSGKPVSCRRLSFGCCATSSTTAAPRSPATSCSTKSGATTPWSPHARWMCMWPGCARS